MWQTWRDPKVLLHVHKNIFLFFSSFFLFNVQNIYLMSNMHSFFYFCVEHVRLHNYNSPPLCRPLLVCVSETADRPDRDQPSCQSHTAPPPRSPPPLQFPVERSVTGLPWRCDTVGVSQAITALHLVVDDFGAFGPDGWLVANSVRLLFIGAIVLSHMWHCERGWLAWLGVGVRVKRVRVLCVHLRAVGGAQDVFPPPALQGAHTQRRHANVPPHRHALGPPQLAGVLQKGKQNVSAHQPMRRQRLEGLRVVAQSASLDVWMITVTWRQIAAPTLTRMGRLWTSSDSEKQKKDVPDTNSRGQTELTRPKTDSRCLGVLRDIHRQ